MEYVYEDELQHHGILGQKWGVRRYQNKDGTLTKAGKRRYANAIAIAPYYTQEQRDSIRNRIRNDPINANFMNSKARKDAEKAAYEFSIVDTREAREKLFKIHQDIGNDIVKKMHLENVILDELERNDPKKFQKFAEEYQKETQKNKIIKDHADKEAAYWEAVRNLSNEANQYVHNFLGKYENKKIIRIGHGGKGSTVGPEMAYALSSRLT